jgi:hypothetical protein
MIDECTAVGSGDLRADMCTLLAKSSKQSDRDAGACILDGGSLKAYSYARSSVIAALDQAFAALFKKLAVDEMHSKCAAHAPRDDWLIVDDDSSDDDAPLNAPHTRAEVAGPRRSERLEQLGEASSAAAARGFAMLNARPPPHLSGSAPQLSAAARRGFDMLNARPPPHLFGPAPQLSAAVRRGFAMVNAGPPPELSGSPPQLSAAARRSFDMLNARPPPHLGQPPHLSAAARGLDKLNSGPPPELSATVAVASAISMSE